jgi:ATP-binding cassette subfamily C (CFTR/MRP) protein 5
MVNYVAAHGIRSLPIYLKDIVNGRIALKRIERVLQYDDKDNYIILTVNPLNSVEFKNATLAWDSYSPKSNVNNVIARQSSSSGETQTKESIIQRSSTLSPTCLYEINLEIPKGKLIGITGSVGSGKTALLRSILGQMRLVNGKVGVRGSTAFVSQQPWIMNATVRDNIAFGYTFNNKRFYEAINYCGLTNDISSLPASDQTEIGERGVNLSGGQKQRISLARAYYADKDIYLLDDPLSSVDRTVGKHIFHHCIRGALKDKTVFLVTNSAEYLEAMDLILFMRDGKILKKGLHKDLYNDDEEYKQLVESSNIDSLDTEEVITRNKTHQEVSDIDDIRFSSPDWGDVQPLPLSKSSSESSLSEAIDIEFREKPDSTGSLVSGRLILEEKIEKGNIAFETYNSYVEAGGGLFICSFVIGWLIFQAVASSFANWWLGYWISQGNGTVSTLDLL